MSNLRARRSSIGRSRAAAMLCLAAMVSLPVQAQLRGAELESARDALREAFDPARAGIFYAASINFAVQPDIATANFKLDGLEDTGIDDPTLVNTRLPLRFSFDTAREDLAPFVQATIGYQDLSMGLPVFGEPIQSDWRSWGIDLGVGVEYDILENWKIVPSVNMGVADLQNKADYGDSPLAPIFQPVFEGILFDWETRAWIAGASLGSLYEREFSGFRLRSYFSGSANYIRSFDESSPDISIRDTATTLDIEVNTVHPIGRIADMEMDLVTVLGATSLVGDARGELGFDDFGEVGLALQFDIRRFGLPIDSVRIGAKAIVGPEVSGWSLIIGQGI